MQQQPDAKRMHALLEAISFVRTAGSPEELRAAQLLQAAASACGIEATIEDFPFEDAEMECAELTVLEPYEQSYTVTAYKCAENTPEGGLVADFMYVENALEANLADARGKIVLVNDYLRLPVYKRLREAGVAALVSMSGTLLDKPEETDLFTRKLRSTLTHFGTMPAVNLRIADGFDLVQRGACKARLCVKGKAVTRTSHNVLATVPGTKYPQQIISFGAHYDSVEFSTGVYDNGAGSVILMELLRYFAENPPLRTVQFVWYGAEEVGLEGSKAFVKARADELAQHLFMVNVDVGGPVLGYDKVSVTAEQAVAHFTEYFMKTKGYPVAVKQEIYSSDSIPFADAGIPAVNFMRNGTQGGAFIHCRDDVMQYLSADALQKTAVPVLDYAQTLVNAVVFPIERKMPPEMTEKIDEYLYKKELGQKDEKANDSKDK